MTLTETRKERNFSQEDLALYTGTSQEYISNIENSRVFPSESFRSRIELVLGREINWIRTRLQGVKIDDRNEDVVGSILRFVHSENALTKREKIHFLKQIIKAI